MTEEFKRSFAELKVTGQRLGLTEPEKTAKDERLIGFLSEALKSGELQSFEDVGFAYWNISDCYALLKRPTELYQNHQRFSEYVKTAQPKYLWWTVSDATQKLTLESGGYGEFWWQLYDEACRNARVGEHFAEFTAHKAAMYTIRLISYREHNITTVSQNFKRFLEGVNGTTEYTFYKCIYVSLAARVGMVTKEDALPLIEPMLSGFKLPKEPRDLLSGEWRSFTTPPCKRRQSEQGINAVIIALLELKETDTAKALYKEACRCGLPRSIFIERAIM